MLYRQEQLRQGARLGHHVRGSVAGAVTGVAGREVAAKEGRASALVPTAGAVGKKQTQKMIPALTHLGDAFTAAVCTGISSLLSRQKASRVSPGGGCSFLLSRASESCSSRSLVGRNLNLARLPAATSTRASRVSWGSDDTQGNSTSALSSSRVSWQRRVNCSMAKLLL